MTETSRSSPFLRLPVDGVDQLPALPGIYVILNRVNGRRYVGQATNVRARCMQHRSDLRAGNSSNMPLRRDSIEFGATAFFFFAPALDAVHSSLRTTNLNIIEVWFAVQMAAHDERFGYNCEAGRRRSPASSFRDREAKLMRRNSNKYVLLPGVKTYDPINALLLESWVPGS